ncbi:MAG: single-stranded DNA-binding protein [Gammaproteobacteria bacterium]|nr:single-stranded DNA-binding protein [Gammaproteobacteria bacterium]
MQLTTIAKRLSAEVNQLSFEAPVTHVYNPLDYAWAAHRRYLLNYGKAPKVGLLIGMNPGPFGMAQTGVPFGEVSLVRDWLGIEEKIGTPPDQHPKRPITGFACTRGEVSGNRLWSWAAQRYQTAERFHSKFFVWNFCPLVFMEESGRNRTPDKLPAAERDALFDVCSDALRRVIAQLKPQHVVGIGRFATDRASVVLGDDCPIQLTNAPHPSPANPAANRGWVPIFESALRSAGVPFES